MNLGADNLKVAEPAEEPRFYTVAAGDTLSKIAKEASSTQPAK